jgi:hypothetical protein
MAAHTTDHAALFVDGRYFGEPAACVLFSATTSFLSAQVPLIGKITPPLEASSVQDIVLSVTKRLLGDSYTLCEDIVTPKDPNGSEVYDILTQVYFPSVISSRR